MGQARREGIPQLVRSLQWMLSVRDCDDSDVARHVHGVSRV
ncbi:MAG: hypothetical protein ACO271_12345 [Burkholderiales bacterium]